METIKFKGELCHTNGTLPKVGEKLPCFELVDSNLKEIDCCEYKDKQIIFNIFPSLDTGVCATSVRKFNERGSNLKDTVVICVSMDLPFAAKRFCTTEGIDNLVVASAFRSDNFSQAYGVGITDGVLKGLFARAIVIADAQHNVVYTELVPEITQEPDYDAAISVLEK